MYIYTYYGNGVIGNVQSLICFLCPYLRLAFTFRGPLPRCFLSQELYRRAIEAADSCLKWLGHGAFKIPSPRVIPTETSTF